MLALLDSHLEQRPYLFGGRPAYGDFGLWGQLYEMWTDPTAGALIEGCAPHVLDWVHRMLWPRAEGPFESWDALEPTLMPILARQVGVQFLTWTAANEKAADMVCDSEYDLFWLRERLKALSERLTEWRRRYGDKP